MEIIMKARAKCGIRIKVDRSVMTARLRSSNNKVKIKVYFINTLLHSTIDTDSGMIWTYKYNFKTGEI